MQKKQIPVTKIMNSQLDHCLQGSTVQFPFTTQERRIHECYPFSFKGKINTTIHIPFNHTRLKEHTHHTYKQTVQHTEHSAVSIATISQPKSETASGPAHHKAHRKWQNILRTDKKTCTLFTSKNCDRHRVSIPPRYVTKPTRSTQPCIPLGTLN